MLGLYPSRAYSRPIPCGNGIPRRDRAASPTYSWGVPTVGNIIYPITRCPQHAPFHSKPSKRAFERQMLDLLSPRSRCRRSIAGKSYKKLLYPPKPPALLTSTGWWTFHVSRFHHSATLRPHEGYAESEKWVLSASLCEVMIECPKNAFWNNCIVQHIEC